MEQKIRVNDTEISFNAEAQTSALLLQEQLLKRSGYSNPDLQNKIVLIIDSLLHNDFQIIPSGENLTLKARNERKMTWLVYQLLSHLDIGNPSSIDQDLPPPLINFKRAMSRNFAFDYMEPYLSPNLNDQNHEIYGTNYLEADWGIWGHNLAKILKPDINRDIYSRVHGKIHENQFCFSSPELYRQLKNYVEDSAAEYFMIMPRDNHLVCTCDRCKSLGNTETSATPAVSFLVEKIALEFPNKKFFTSSYHTTTEPPKKKLPSNTGVMVSTIQFPLNANSETTEFKKLVRNWNHKVSSVFVWDYVSNFDDYLTPFPVVNVMQKRLQLYKNLGVEGIFLNGSGYDFASSQRYKTYILSGLMYDPYLDVNKLSKSYFSKYFPSTGMLLYNYFHSLEDNLAKSRKDLRIYGSMQQNVWSYLDSPTFFKFFEEISKAEPSTQKERERLAPFLAALNFTYLQLRLLNGIKKNGWAKKEKSTLFFDQQLNINLEYLEKKAGRHSITVYSEAGATLKDYIQTYRAFINSKSVENLLLSVDLEPVDGITPYQNTYLNDGVFGFPTDKHIGWVQIPNNFTVKFTTGSWGEKTLTANFLILENYGIYAPKEIQIFKKGKLIHTVIPTEKNGLSESRFASFKSSLNLNEKDEILVKVIQPNQNGTNITAIDELILN